jgi:poly-gamma-glutamate synthesis protein (capsule biosynthesis protein)
MSPSDSNESADVTFFFCGDVMTGRGIDQILKYPSDPTLHESYMKDARGYAALAERDGTVIPRGVDDRYIWGDALQELELRAPDLRIINLETSVTTSDDAWPGKGINYRMNPRNAGCLTAAGIDCCALANNHVIDWGYAGLEETLDTLRSAGIQTAGAGHNRDVARRPAVFDLPGRGRVLVFSFGSQSSGIPGEWEAEEDCSGVCLVDESSSESLSEVGKQIEKFRQSGDLVIVSIHWGGNWGYRIPQEQKRFAHALVDDCGVDVVHGHSSHHVKGIEVYCQRPIFYGCGDFLTDYEGIRGYDEFRGDLGLMYFVTIDCSTRALADCRMVPTQMKRFQVRRAAKEDIRRLTDVLNREGQKQGTRVEMLADREVRLHWE